MKYKIKRYLAEIEESLGYVDVYIDDLDNPNSMEQIREYSKDILLNACKLSMILEEDKRR